MDGAGAAVSSPHVLFFPLPLQGPVNCMLKLAELLCLAGGIRVTFLNTHHIHRRLLRHTDFLSRFARYPTFRFETISDGLPEDHRRTVDGFDKMMDAMDAVTKPLLRDFLASRAPTAMIADGVFGFALHVAQEAGVPLIYFETISPCALWTYLCIPKLIEAGELPFKGDDLDAKITSVPGLDSLLRRRDLPRFCRADNLSNYDIQLALREAQQIPRAHGLILNTFEELDGPVLTQIRTFCPNTYAIGPLHALFNTRLSPTRAHSNSLWEEDRSCLAWLDAQPPKSVIFISFGSHAVMSVHQLMEIWHGVANSGRNFLWVRRPGSVVEKEADFKISAELLEITKERGFIVGWAPQEEVLAHPAIGAFLTHSGWNSTLESIVEGVPMVCWPCFLDQQVISRFVSEVWKLGCDMKDTCDRVIIENVVRTVMEVRRDEFMQSANETKKSARESACKGGSSYRNLDRLIEDIKSMNIAKSARASEFKKESILYSKF
ncbi:hypothetical protein RJ639_038415 [Escallonia herrerae]|uniref:Glycosyltransferase n=1 Tax=Escallonia herrerae TaxID=1293975 RepID=A0AA88WLA1_9ASTE|nr:hypothetical protein RJ639_038415 [Escallonia herrerae]